MRSRRVLTALSLAALVTVSACADTEDASPESSALESLPPATDPAPTATDLPPGDTIVEGAATTTTVAPTTTPPDLPPEPPQLYTERGPYLSGVTTIDLGDREAEVWYPVDAGDVEGATTEIFDTLSVFPASLQDLIPPELSGEVDTQSYRDVPVSLDAPFPVVVFSHGFGGYRQTSTGYTSHLASWGFVVVSTDHLERGIAAQATGQLQNIPGQDVRDVERSLEVLGESALADAVDLGRVGIAGHSAGAGTAARAALDLDSIDSFVSISGGAPTVTTGDDINASVGIQGAGTEYRVDVQAVTDTDATISIDRGEPQTVPLDALAVTVGEDRISLQVETGKKLKVGVVRAERTAPEKPGLVVIAQRDEVVVPPSSRTLFRLLTSPKFEVEIAEAGHNSFTDSCIGIRALGGLQSLVPLLGEAQVARAEDGCTDAYVDPVLATAVLNHYSVAFFRTTLGIADDTATLEEDVTPQIDQGTVSLSAFDPRP